MLHQPNSSQTVPPLVTVLLATHNGERWLGEQLDSILSQEGIDLRVIALDDASTDSTPALLAERSRADTRLTVLPAQRASGSAAANFYRLLRTISLDDAGFIAFADQDDIWRPGKLQRHAALLRDGSLDGVSSDVIAFSTDGSRSLVRKSFPQRRFDYLLESPGPGCSFLISPRLAELTKQRLEAADSVSTGVDFHDWLIYALCRAAGWGWCIDNIPSLDYRQHDSNAMGANVGARPAFARLALIFQRWHRTQASTIARVALEVTAPASRQELESLLDALQRRGFRARWVLLSHAGQVRRRPRDRAIIGFLIALGIW
jgi:rhamnosyltransferase